MQESGDDERLVSVEVRVAEALGAGNDFASFVHARQKALVRTAFLLSGDATAAEDIAQNALAKLYLAWNRLGSVDHPDAYVRRVLVNEANSWHRKPWRRREIVVAELPDSIVDATETTGVIWEWVSTLPSKQRAVIVLRYYEGLSDPEIGEVLEIATSTVSSQASRALASLRTRIPSEVQEGDM